MNINGNKVIYNEKINFDLPENWCLAPLNTVMDVRDGTHDSPKYHSTGIPFVTSKNLKNGQIDFSTCKLISEEDSIKFNIRSKVDDFDILFAMIGTIGNPVIVHKTFEFSIKNVALFKNINRKLISEKWICMILDALSNDMKQQTSSGLQPFVSLDFLRNYLIPVPPINEQLRIIEKYKQVEYLFEKLKRDNDEMSDLCYKTKLAILDSIFYKNSSYKSYYENVYKIGDILGYVQPGPYIVNNTNYDDSYNTPVLTPGKTFILGYTNEKNGIYHADQKDKVIIFKVKGKYDVTDSSTVPAQLICRTEQITWEDGKTKDDVGNVLKMIPAFNNDNYIYTELCPNYDFSKDEIEIKVDMREKPAGCYKFSFAALTKNGTEYVYFPSNFYFTYLPDKN